jgi:hypothetical protein
MDLERCHIRTKYCLGRPTAGISKKITITTYGKVPGAMCRDSLLMAQACPQLGDSLRTRGSFGKDVITLWAVEKWTTGFAGGCAELVNLPRSGRLCDIGKVDAVRALSEGKRNLSRKKIASMLSIDHETVKCVLRDDLNMRKVNFKWVPYALNDSQKACRIQVS